MKNIKVLSVHELLNKFFKWFTKEKRMIFFVTFLACFFANILVVTNDIITTDAVSLGEVYTATAWDLSLGRWFLKFSESFRLGICSSVVTSLISFILMGFSVVLLTDLFRIKSRLLKYSSAFLFACAPFFSDTLLSVYCAPDFTLAFFLSILCVYLLYEKKSIITSFVLPCFFLAILLGIYQAYLGVVCGLCLFLPIIYLLKKIETPKEIFQRLIKSICFGICGILLYWLILQMLLLITGVSMATYGGANKIGLSTIFNIPKYLSDTYFNFYSYFMDDLIINNLIYHRNIIHIILFVMILIFIIFSCKSNKLGRKTILFLFLLIILIPIALGILVVIAPDRPFYCLMSAPYMLVYVFLLSLMDEFYLNRKAKLLSSIAIFAFVAVIYSYFLMMNATYMSVRITKEKTVNAANNIAREIYNISGYQDDIKILFVGRASSKYFSINQEIYHYANSIALYEPLMWEDPYLCNRGWHHIMRYYLGISFLEADISCYDEIIQSEEYKNMNIYPLSSFVRVINNVIVVKIS